MNLFFNDLKVLIYRALKKFKKNNVEVLAHRRCYESTSTRTIMDCLRFIRDNDTVDRLFFPYDCQFGRIYFFNCDVMSLTAAL